jgi:hypothetical protein
MSGRLPGMMIADTDLYETDVLAWSERQAEALRELAVLHDLPSALDLAHVVGEIEDVAQRELNEVKSFIRPVLGHAIKCLADPNALSVRHWHAEIGNWQSALADRVTPSMRRRIDLDVLWRRAVRQAELDLAEQESDAAAVAKIRALRDKPRPVSIGDIPADPADPATLVSRMEQALGGAGRIL